MTAFNRLLWYFHQENIYLCVSVSFSLACSIYICVQQALESIPKCNGADVNNNDSNICELKANSLCVWISVGFSMHSHGWNKRAHSDAETFAGKRCIPSVYLSLYLPFYSTLHRLCNIVQQPKLSPCMYVALEPITTSTNIYCFLILNVMVLNSANQNCHKSGMKTHTALSSTKTLFTSPFSI